MAARPPRAERRRRLRGASLERPVNARMYRGTWLLVGIPLLLASLGVGRVVPVPPPALPPSFDRDSAVSLARDLAAAHPNREPGTPGGAAAARWVAERLRTFGLRPEQHTFTAEIPGRGRVGLVNVLARVPGRSQDAVVVMAHRDNRGVSPGANDNASGTAALLEIARSYGFVTDTNEGGGPRVEPPSQTIVFVSTDGGAYGGLGAREFVARGAYGGRVATVLVLDAIGGSGRPRLELAGATPRSPPAALVESLAVRVLEQTGRRPDRPSLLEQLTDLAFPLSFYEQASIVAAGVPAVGLTTGGDGAPADFGDSPPALVGPRLTALGRAAQRLVASLEQGVEFERTTSARLYLGPRAVGGWSLQLVLVAALLPFFAAVVDLVARCRRHHIRLMPALLGYARRLAFWLALGAGFAVLGAMGVWPGGEPVPPPPASDAARDWPLLGLALLAAFGTIAWLVARDGLLPRRNVGDSEELGGAAAALLVLAVLSLVVAVLNAYALLLLLPSLHAWLWLPQVRGRAPWIRASVLALGYAGPLLLLASLAGRFGLGADAPWYLLALVAVGSIGPAAVVVTLAWAAAAAQLSATAAHRYTPARTAAELADRPGLLRRLGRVTLERRRGRDPAVSAAEESAAAESWRA